jgi:hypothetical protein
MGQVPSPWHARAALADARTMRSEYLVSVSHGFLTALDVIMASERTEGIALRSLSLRQLTLARPHVGEARSKALLSEVSARLGLKEDISGRTISWLTQPSVRGSRFFAWLDAEQSFRTPWPGFPVAPRPQEGTAAHV